MRLRTDKSKFSLLKYFKYFKYIQIFQIQFLKRSNGIGPKSQRMKPKEWLAFISLHTLVLT